MSETDGRKIISFAGNGSYSNRGCEAIVRGTAILLREALGECQFISHYISTHACKDKENENDPDILHDPFPASKRYSLPWFENRIRKSVFRQPDNIIGVRKVLNSSITRTNCVLMLGGDNFSLDYGRPDLFFEIADVILKHKKPCIIWGASVGPFSKDPDYERWAAKTLRHFNLICARETETFEYLLKLDLRENVMLTADPAYCLPMQPVQLPDEVKKLIDHGCIGINLSPLIASSIYATGSWLKNLDLWADQAIKFLDQLCQAIDVPILLIPHVTSDVGDIGGDDFIFLDRIARASQNQERIVVLGPNFNAAQTKWIISQTKIFIGARTHSTLAAISSGVPTICIGYSVKARGIAKDVYGNLDWLVNAHDFQQPEMLIDKIQHLMICEKEIRAHLIEISPSFVQKANDAAMSCKELIENIPSLDSK